MVFVSVLAELNRTEHNRAQTQPNRTEPNRAQTQTNQTEPNRTKPNQTKLHTALGWLLAPSQNELERTIAASSASASAAGERLPPSPGKEERQTKIAALESEVHNTVTSTGGSCIV